MTTSCYFPFKIRQLLYYISISIPLFKWKPGKYVIMNCLVFTEAGLTPTLVPLAPLEGIVSVMSLIYHSIKKLSKRTNVAVSVHGILKITFIGIGIFDLYFFYYHENEALVVEFPNMLLRFR